jgi:hypothetical protein
MPLCDAAFSNFVRLFCNAFSGQRLVVRLRRALG